MSDLLLVNNIQRFCLHDGAGIRTTVFLMGCALNCPWCANPESRLFNPLIQFKQKKCIARDGRCFLRSDCPIIQGQYPLTDLSEKDAILCLAGAISLNGNHYTPEKLSKEVMEDKPFYSHGGGVTLSGGEPLLQSSALIPFAEIMLQNGINLCVESSLYVPSRNLKDMLPYVNDWIVDLKLAVPELFNTVLGGDFAVYNDNLRFLLSSGRKVTLRIPVVPGITDIEENLESVRKLLKELPPVNVEIFSVHNLAENKYKELGIQFHHFQPATSHQLEHIREYLFSSCKNITICSL